jgi:16S rRNA (cytosine1402-N4)-methyltransferase
MTMEHNKDGVTAIDVVNTWAEETLATIIYGFGEERYSRRIAKAIVTARAIEPITRTTQLVDIIRGSVPASYRNGKINPATRTFQAIRIAVNQELDNINEGLTAAWNVLVPGGRIACISKKEEGAKIITKKPITPTDTEISSNPRSRSAKLRIIEK